MSDHEIARKINEIKINSFDIEQRNINLLIQIHKYLFFDGAIRCEEKYIVKINETIEELFDINYFEDEYEISKKICKCVSIIKLYQPFYDGNHSAIICLIKLLFLNSNFDFEINAYNLKRFRKLIPIIYTEREKIPSKNIRLVKRNLFAC